MNRHYRLIIACLGLTVFGVWFIFVTYVTSTFLAYPQPTNAEAAAEIQGRPTPASPATFTPTLAPTRVPSPTLIPTLPELYVDGPYIKRSDTRQSTWLKGVNIEEFRQRNPHTLVDLLGVQGLERIIQQKWGINLLRVAVDPETVETNSSELSKLIAFAQANGMYVILVPFASAVNPARNDQALPVPDSLVATAMGYLADQFKGRTNVLYGIWNEPHPDSIPTFGYERQWEAWMNAGIKVAQAIRIKNPKAILVVPGGNKWARDMTFYQTHPFPFNNVIYDVHDYWAYPAYDYSRLMWTWAVGKYPILLGEFGGDPTKPFDSTNTTYMQETIRLVNQHPELMHYTMYALTNDGVWGIFTRDLANMPKGNLLHDDLQAFPPTRFQLP